LTRIEGERMPAKEALIPGDGTNPEISDAAEADIS
jgi:hypothetical protein